MYREKLRQRLKTLRRVKTWQLAVVLLFGAIVAVTLLRLNSLNMMDYRHAVVVADEQGDKAAIRSSLADLQRYVSSHMNTGLAGGFYLSKSYDRDSEAAISAASNVSNPNSVEYQTASIECRAKWQGGRDSFRNDYVRCVIDRVAALTGQAEPASEASLPNPESYKINYASPLWSADPAGFAVLFCAIVVMIIIFRAIVVIVLKILLKRRFSSV